MTTVQMRSKGTITLPASLRKKYNLEDGELFTIIDLGEGSILIKAMVSQVNKLGDKIARQLKEDNVTLDDLLETLDEERQRYYQEHYAEK